MTDSNLMDAKCIHGNLWYDCAQCDSSSCLAAENYGIHSEDYYNGLPCQWCGDIQR